MARLNFSWTHHPFPSLIADTLSELILAYYFIHLLKIGLIEISVTFTVHVVVYSYKVVASFLSFFMVVPLCSPLVQEVITVVVNSYDARLRHFIHLFF